MALRTLLPLTRTTDPFFGMARDLDRFFNDTLRDFPVANVTASFGVAPKLDVSETDQAITVTAEIPGVDEKDIDLTFSDGVLTIKGEKKSVRNEKSETLHLVERSYGAFSRSLALPAEVDADKILARFEKGILTVTLPKQAKVIEKSKKIAVTAG